MIVFSEQIGPAPASTRWTVLCLDFQYILSMYLNRRYSYMKSIKLCANMLVKNIYTSDLDYEPGWFKHILFQNKLDCQQVQSLRVAFHMNQISIFLKKILSFKNVLQLWFIWWKIVSPHCILTHGPGKKYAIGFISQAKIMTQQYIIFIYGTRGWLVHENFFKPSSIFRPNF